VKTAWNAIVAIISLAATVTSIAADEPGQPQAAQRKVAPAKVAPTQPYKADCSISPELCMTAPVARGCGKGWHWSSAGSGLAHCVEDDRDCADGKAGKRDEYDNLVCADEKEAAGEAVRKQPADGAFRA